MQLLLLSSSRANNSEYLAPYMPWLQTHLTGCTELLFIPYAGVTISYDAYVTQVATALAPLKVKVSGLHQYAKPQQAIKDAQAIAVGGGNTFKLLNELYQKDILQLIAERVTSGTPYIGWSAGANIAGSTICTTNDMPIIAPPSFDGLKLLPLQLNPHYIDMKAEGFHGEARDMRLAEFMTLQPKSPIIALPEGSALKRQGQQLTLLGRDGGYLFVGGDKTALLPDTDLSAFI
ncbi:dipeptidase PepE [Arsukibacterium sp.]|uniref:dipeptidase PepE n=1 Tax=Arsukibacterium sp. TaxID=1977258 RepID=UPI002FDAA2DF